MLTTAPDCRVCLIPHDAEIHEATLRVHADFRARLLRLFDEPESPKPSKGESWPSDKPDCERVDVTTPVRAPRKRGMPDPRWDTWRAEHEVAR